MPIVTLSLFAGAGAQFLDNNGDILSGGLIYTYTAGTTTPLTTYTTNLGTVAQPNPIVLDSAGRIPGGELWLTIGYGYKFVTKDSNGVLIGTYDNVPSSAQPPITNDTSSIYYEEGYSVTAGAFVIGDTYLITSIGTTNFQLIGASANEVGVHFIATGIGSGTGTAQFSRTAQARLQDFLSAKDFGAVGNGIVDDTFALQTALTAANLNNKTLFIPAGIYVTTSQLTVNGTTSKKYLTVLGESKGADGLQGTIIKYIGSPSSSVSVLEARNISTASFSNLQFFANDLAGKAFTCVPDAGVNYASGYYFQNVLFEKATQYGFYISGSSVGDRFNFQSCDFSYNPIGFYTGNFNSLSHAFTACAFNKSQYGIYINGGSFSCYSCEFSQQSISDIYIQACNACSINNCWSEQSNRFLLADYRTNYAPITVLGCTIGSYPWSYWKINNETTAQPTNDYTQWLSIDWEGDRGGISLINSGLSDPFQGVSTGSIAPLTSSIPLIGAVNGPSVIPPEFAVINSSSRVGNNITNEFTVIGGSLISQNVVTKIYYPSTINDIYSGSSTVQPVYYSTYSAKIFSNTIFTLSTNFSNAGDIFTLVIVQGVSGGFTCTFVNALVAGGIFTPSAAGGSMSSITFEFDGIKWQQRSTALNIH